MTNEDEGGDSLVIRAKAAPPGKFRGVPVTDELTDLALAFVKGDVNSSQAATVLGCARQSAVQRCWTAFRRAVLAGRIEVTDGWSKKVAESYEEELGRRQDAYQRDRSGNGVRR